MKNLWKKMCKSSLVRFASLLVIVGGSIGTMSMYPFWHYEPEMPDSLKAKLAD